MSRSDLVQDKVEILAHASNCKKESPPGLDYPGVGFWFGNARPLYRKLAESELSLHQKPISPQLLLSSNSEIASPSFLQSQAAWDRTARMSYPQRRVARDRSNIRLLSE